MGMSLKRLYHDTVGRFLGDVATQDVNLFQLEIQIGVWSAGGTSVMQDEEWNGKRGMEEEKARKRRVGLKKKREAANVSMGRAESTNQSQGGYRCF